MADALALGGDEGRDKLRVGANDLRSADFRMGQPGTLKKYHPALQEANAGN